MKIYNEREARIKTAKSLKREYDMLKARADKSANQAELEYNMRMVEATGARIEWNLLKVQKKVETESDDDYYDYE